MKEVSRVVYREKEAARDTVTFRGHPMVRSTHPTTVEVTTEEHLTEKGDCIIGVGASKGCEQLDTRVKERLRRKESRVTIRLLVGSHSFELRAVGDPRLELSHPCDIVIRKSEFFSDRTLAVRSSAAAKDLPRDLVRMLKNPDTVGRLDLEVF